MKRTCVLLVLPLSIQPCLSCSVHAQGPEGTGSNKATAAIVFSCGKEYDICSECWNPFAQKLRGKGRVKNRETVFLPAPRINEEREDEEPGPLPGELPKIWGAVERPH